MKIGNWKLKQTPMKIKKGLLFLLVLFINLIPVFCLAATATTGEYVPMEEIPGFGKPEDFPSYLMAIYKFGLWAIGTSAMFMIMLGGYMYLTSAGNNSQTGKAKGIITDAIAGLILALVSYVLLWTINPELVQFKPLIGLPTTTTPTTSIGAISTNAGYKNACPDPSSTSPIVFSGTNAESPSPTCATLIPNDVGGIKKEILRTIAQIESNCGANKKSPAGACGLMQLMPDTAKRTCDELIADDKLSVELAAKYISDNQSTHIGNIEKILAGYNSGYATNGKGGLAPSVDCPGSLKYQCCKNPQELDETIGYVWKGVGIMKKQ